MKTVLFDLDGTLIDSQEGIINSVKYALQHLGMEEHDPEVLRKFIGPPLMDSFQRTYGFDHDTASEAVRTYRELYQRKGMYECHLYPEVKEVILDLKAKGYHIGTASSKPEEYCIKILERLGVAELFDEITGAYSDKVRSTKVEVLVEAIERAGCEKQDVVLIGDTRYDCEGARAAGVLCIGITYGFGTREELTDAGADIIFDTLWEAEKYIERI